MGLAEKILEDYETSSELDELEEGFFSKAGKNQGPFVVVDRSSLKSVATHLITAAKGMKGSGLNPAIAKQVRAVAKQTRSESRSRQPTVPEVKAEKLSKKQLAVSEDRISLWVSILEQALKVILKRNANLEKDGSSITGVVNKAKLLLVNKSMRSTASKVAVVSMLAAAYEGLNKAIAELSKSFAKRIGATAGARPSVGSKKSDSKQLGTSHKSAKQVSTSFKTPQKVGTSHRTPLQITDTRSSRANLIIPHA